MSVTPTGAILSMVIVFGACWCRSLLICKRRLGERRVALPLITASGLGCNTQHVVSKAEVSQVLLFKHFPQTHLIEAYPFGDTSLSVTCRFQHNALWLTLSVTTSLLDLLMCLLVLHISARNKDEEQKHSLWEYRHQEHVGKMTRIMLFSLEEHRALKDSVLQCSSMLVVDDGCWRTAKKTCQCNN